MLEGIYNRLACDSPNPRILCGDFNAPQKELPSGYVLTWGQWFLKNGQITCSGTWRDSQGREDVNERWDAGERGIFEGLRGYDLWDVFRTLHGYEVEEYSHYVHKRMGRRFDHVFASTDLNVVKCEYAHKLREDGLSDHSPMMVVFKPKGKCNDDAERI
jgi:exonuclease III